MFLRRLCHQLVLALVLVAAGLQPAGASPEALAWTTQFGTDSYDIAVGVASDPSGHTYVVGSTYGSLPGQASAGSADGFLAKFDPSGTLLWARQIGASRSDEVKGVAVDPSGNVYVAGSTELVLPGPRTSDAFVAKYDGSGMQLWIRQFGTTSSDVVNGIAVDASGNVLLAGQTFGGTFPGEISAGGGDGFVAKYDPSGAHLWVRQFGTEAFDFATGVAVDHSGNAYLAGSTHGTLPGQTLTGAADGFVAKFGPSGTELWARQLGTTSSDHVSGVAVDASGNAYLSGWTLGAFAGQTGAGNDDGFIAKYDSSGSPLWVSQFGTSSYDYASAVAVDSGGTVSLAGSTDGTFPGQTSAGSTDAIVAKYDSSGRQLWLRQFGGGGADSAHGVALDSSGGTYVAGRAGDGLPGHTALGSGDAFVAKAEGGNSFPVAAADSFTHYGTDTALAAPAPGVLTNDTDTNAQSLSAALLRAPRYGTITLRSDGSFIYRPNEDFVGSDSFTYTVTDGTAISAPAAVTLTVEAGCNGRRATITGTSTSEKLKGTPDADVIAGLGGDDKIQGKGGNDTICGGGGADRIDAGPGNDHVNGGSGDNVLRGKAGDDTVLGSEGDDTLAGGPG